MARYIKQSGVRVKNDKFMLDFTHDGVRFRVLTKISAIKTNRSKAERILSAIKLDLERGQFHLANFASSIVNPNYLEKLDVNYLLKAKEISVVNLLDEQLSVYEQRVTAGTLAPASFDAYNYAAELHLKKFFTGVSVTQVTPKMLEQLINILPFTRKRIALILAPLRITLKKAKRNGLIEVNPFDGLDNDYILTIAVESEYKVQPFSNEEIKLILDSSFDQGILNLIQFGFWTGMRLGEIFALTWSDVNFKLETINVTKSKSVRSIIKSPKTKAGIREVEMTPLAKDALLKQLKLTGSDTDDIVFKTPTGKSWYKPGNFGQYWKRILNAVGVEYRNPYQMRHTFISHMLALGNSPLVLYRMVGHENTEMIYKKYARFVKQGTGKQLKTS